MHRAILVLIGLKLLVGCVAYKVAPTKDFEARAPMIREHVVARPEETIAIVQLNSFPEGAHCFEPLMYVLSLGIIPIHCRDRYHVNVSSGAQAGTEDRKTDFEVTSMQGWVALLLPLSPQWRFGYGDRVEEEIRSEIVAE